MKNQKLFLCCLLVIGSTLYSTLQAQDEDSQQEDVQQQEAAEQDIDSQQNGDFRYKRFRGTLQGGAAILLGASDTGADYFYGISAEFNYEIIPNLQIGIRVHTSARIVIDGGTAFEDIPFMQSEMLTVDYFYLDTKLRPFVGLGIGYAEITDVVKSADNFFISNSNDFLL